MCAGNAFPSVITEDGATEVRDVHHHRDALRLRGVCDVVDVRDALHPRLDRARQRLRSLQNRHK